MHSVIAEKYGFEPGYFSPRKNSVEKMTKVAKIYEQKLPKFV